MGLLPPASARLVTQLIRTTAPPHLLLLALRSYDLPYDIALHQSGAQEPIKQGETLSPKEYNDTQGWVVAHERRKKAKDKRNAEPATNAGGASMEASRRQKDFLRRRPVPKEPQLPEDDYKVVIRPGGGPDVTRQSLALIRDCVLRAAKVQPDIAGEDTLRINMRQNTIIMSTPSLANAKEYSNIKEIMINDKSYATAAYVTALENTSKGVIHGIPNVDISDLDQVSYPDWRGSTIGRVVRKVVQPGI
ncbi:hypothetical protein HPB51_028891 [Rhipicephalus microplus]|uniref:Uncharacterized protein n=1 Tax=Rhipicephalus microplus TaxID=6941 RepID=A0A9J6CW23_RHIMP|nr:hypothetical protein HPB51_028891 [Rhipicephalus microplus]